MQVELEENRDSKRIGGWLLLYLILTIISTGLYAMGIINNTVPNLSHLTENKSGIELVVVVFLFVETIVKLGASILILILFISKKNYAPRVIVGFELFCVLVRLITIGEVVLVFHMFPKPYYVSAIIGVISIVWVLYFVRSKRVKETFVQE